MSTKMQDLLARAHVELRYQPVEKRVRANVGADAVVDSRRAILVWEPRRVVPSYAVPVEDIRPELQPAPATNGHVPGVLHPGIPFSVHTADGRPVTIEDRVGAGYWLTDEDLAGYVVLDMDGFDAWYEEDEPIVGHPRDPYHRVDVRLSRRPLRIEVDGDVVAETTRARVLFETQLTRRFYVPREDIRAEIHATDTRTYCPYKGAASYWTVDAGGRLRKDLGWTYEEPLPDAVAIAGLVAFWNERVDVFIDGEQQARPGGPIAAAMIDEFGLTER